MFENVLFRILHHSSKFSVFDAAEVLLQIYFKCPGTVQMHLGSCPFSAPIRLTLDHLFTNINDKIMLEINHYWNCNLLLFTTTQTILIL